jgi:2-phosphosulfolactate phosphatase
MPTVHTHFLPSLISAESLRGSVAIVIDLLRASTTILRALDSGADRVIPCLEPDEARAVRARLLDTGIPADRIVLGGERGGIRIPGFDLDNSPARYTPEAVRARTVVFTTTNGTRALFAARDRGASKILIGCLNNLSALVEHVSPAGAAAGARPVHIICAGTNGQVSQEDVLCAGAIVDALMHRRFAYSDDDQARIAHAYWNGVKAMPDGVLDALRSSRGGRNLLRLGFDGDVADCARLDTSRLVPVVGPDGSIIPGTVA